MMDEVYTDAEMLEFTKRLMGHMQRLHRWQDDPYGNPFNDEKLFEDPVHDLYLEPIVHIRSGNDPSRIIATVQFEDFGPVLYWNARPS